MNWSSCSQNGIATFDCIGPLLQTIISWLFVFVGIIALFLIIYAGIRFITSGGDAKQVESARKILTYAIIGLIIVLSSFFIINLIANFTGASCIKLFGFSSCGTPSAGGGPSGGGVTINCASPKYCYPADFCNSTYSRQIVSGTCYTGEVCCKDIVTAPGLPDCASPNYCYPTDFCNSTYKRTLVPEYSCYGGGTSCCKDVATTAPTSVPVTCASPNYCYPTDFCNSTYSRTTVSGYTCGSGNTCCKDAAAPTTAPTTCASPNYCYPTDFCNSTYSRTTVSGMTGCGTGTTCCKNI